MTHICDESRQSFEHLVSKYSHVHDHASVSHVDGSTPARPPSTTTTSRSTPMAGAARRHGTVTGGRLASAGAPRGDS
ncbi:hypothetical protein [Pseudonocardia sp. TRM90224]|uniref:hypothetical protein n=1 Tax=Pseudonocardia sp. TRM90224 TaxID=2812678 RepID=UPI001E2918A8|nr:hypothetical protein [Pseudonocardia sp. TRM90224]